MDNNVDKGFIGGYEVAISALNYNKINDKLINLNHVDLDF
jgi:hypothetical protein